MQCVPFSIRQWFYDWQSSTIEIDRPLFPDLEDTSDTTYDLPTSSFTLPTIHMELPPTQDLAIATGPALRAAFAFYHARK